MKIVIYCPDEHLEYDGNTPEKVGVGGGITVRIRMAAALSALGHQVLMFANVANPGEYDGVYYENFRNAKDIDCDVLMIQSTGGELNLSALQKANITSKITVARFGGVAPIKSWKEFNPKIIYLNSNFTRRNIISQWDISSDQVFVLYNGLDLEKFRDVSFKPASLRDPFGLLYVGHPAKGLGRAQEILKELRKADERFHLDIFGGYELWGQKKREMNFKDGVHYLGNLPKNDLLKRIPLYRYALFIQSYEEPFGISAQEARKAGVISLCTPVGAYPELFHHGYDGIIIDEPYESDFVVKKTVDMILSLNNHDDYIDYISQNASRVNWSWNVMAQTLLAHWQLLLNDKSVDIQPADYFCSECFSRFFIFPDGFHCLQCGNFIPSVSDHINIINDGFYPYAGWVHEYNRYKIRMLKTFKLLLKNDLDGFILYKQTHSDLYSDKIPEIHFLQRGGNILGQLKKLFGKNSGK